MRSNYYWVWMILFVAVGLVAGIGEVPAAPVTTTTTLSSGGGTPEAPAEIMADTTANIYIYVTLRQPPGPSPQELYITENTSCSHVELHTTNAPEYPNWFQLYRMTWAPFSWYDLHAPCGQSDTTYMVDPVVPGFYCDPYRWCGTYVAVDSFLDTNWDGGSRGVCDVNRNYFYTVVVVETLTDGRLLYSPVSDRPVGEFDQWVSFGANFLSYPVWQKKLSGGMPIIDSSKFLGEYMYDDLGLGVTRLVRLSGGDYMFLSRRFFFMGSWRWTPNYPIRPGIVFWAFKTEGVSGAPGLFKTFTPGYVPFDSTLPNNLEGEVPPVLNEVMMPFQVYNYIIHDYLCADTAKVYHMVVNINNTCPTSAVPGQPACGAPYGRLLFYDNLTHEGRVAVKWTFFAGSWRMTGPYINTPLRPGLPYQLYLQGNCNWPSY